MTDSAALEHVLEERDNFETKVGISYCRRCGRVLTKDNDPTFRQEKPCGVVKVGYRWQAV